MRSRTTKGLTVLLLLVLVASVVPGLAGCGNGGTTGKPEIMIGFIGDITGPGALGVKHMYEGMRDYFRMVEETDMLPDINVKFVPYDSKGERGRVPVGYNWLKGQGAMLISTISGAEIETILDKLEEDKIANFSAQASPTIMGKDWAFGWLPLPGAQGEQIIQFIRDDWQGESKAKVGFVGLNALIISRDILTVCEDEYASGGDFDLVSPQMVPYGTMTWAVEISRLKQCDYIVNTLIGPSAASFVQQIRSAGWDGKIIGCMESFLAFWDLVRAASTPDQLDGSLCSNPYVWWNESVPFINECKEYAEKYLSPDDAASVMRNCGRIGGWGWGMIAEAAIERAVDSVGAKNVNSQVLRDAIAATDLTVEGWGNTWEVVGDVNCFLQTTRVMEYNGAQEEWTAITDWYRPPSLGG